MVTKGITPLLLNKRDQFAPLDYGELNYLDSPEPPKHKIKNEPPQAINLNELYIKKPTSSRRNSHRKSSKLNG